MLDFVNKFRERLHHANSLAKESLLSCQTVMKSRNDRSAVISVGDKVLALLPIPGPLTLRLIYRSLRAS